MCYLLIKRGIDTPAKAQKYFRPQLGDLHDPFLMNDMDIAVDRLNKAMGRKERILIYGDYDVDGTTAVALIYRFLQILAHCMMGNLENKTAGDTVLYDQAADFYAERFLRLRSSNPVNSKKSYAPIAVNITFIRLLTATMTIRNNVRQGLLPV